MFSIFSVGISSEKSESVTISRRVEFAAQLQTEAESRLILRFIEDQIKSNVAGPLSLISKYSSTGIFLQHFINITLTQNETSLRIGLMARALVGSIIDPSYLDNLSKLKNTLNVIGKFNFSMSCDDLAKIVPRTFQLQQAQELAWKEELESELGKPSWFSA